MTSRQKTNSKKTKDDISPENIKREEPSSPSSGMEEELVNETKKISLNRLEKKFQVDEDDKYALFQETSGRECESWYFFIRYKGNEKNLEHLASQLNSVEFYVIDEMSTFDIDLKNLVSAKTAKEMSKVEINSVRFHGKYDGTLQKIDLEFRDRDSDETKICKANDILADGGIEEFLDGEDIDSEDMISDGESEEESSEESPSPSLYKNQTRNLPKVLQQSNLPRFAQRKRKNNRKR
jgi:hypothetical protein